jgi:SulP family sulfate permease
VSKDATTTADPPRWRRAVPGLASIGDGLRNHLAGDTRAALTVWAVVVPQSLAYASLAGVPSVHGLYTAIAALAVYALFGTCRDLNMGPESTVALMVAASVAPIAASAGAGAEDVVALTSMVAILVGVWCVLGHLFKLGFLSDLLSRPILAGYVFGSGIVIVVSQIEALFGISFESELHIIDLVPAITELGDADAPTTMLGLATIVLVLGLRKLAPKVPAPLVAVVLGILAVVVFDLDQEGVAVVGNIDGGIPTPALPGVGFDQLTQLLLPALGIALLAYPDSFLTARSLSSKGGYPIDADQEMLAVGASNLASGLLQGIPVNGSQSRSFVQYDAGGRTNLVGLVCGGLTLVTALFLTGLFEKLPLTVLAGIVIVAGIGLFELAEFRKLWHLRRIEFWVGVVTVTSVLVFGMLGGIAFAIGLSLLLVLMRVARPRTAALGRVGDTDTFRSLDRPDTEAIDGLLIFRVDDELFFANVSYVLRDLQDRIDEAEPPYDTVLLDLEGVSAIDTTAVEHLHELLDHLDHRGIDLLVARVRQPVRSTLQQSGLSERVGADQVFLDVDDAVRWYADHRRT